MKVLPCYRFEIHFNIIFPPTRTCSEWFVPPGYPNKTPRVPHTSPISFFFSYSSIQYTSGEQWAAFNIHLASSELHSIYIWRAVSCIQYISGEQWAPFNIHLASSELHSIYIWRAVSSIQYISGEQWALIQYISGEQWAAFNSSLCSLLQLNFTTPVFDPDRMSSSVPRPQTVSANVRLSPSHNICHTHRQQHTQLCVCMFRSSYA